MRDNFFFLLRIFGPDPRSSDDLLCHVEDLTAPEADLLARCLLGELRADRAISNYDSVIAYGESHLQEPALVRFRRSWRILSDRFPEADQVGNSETPKVDAKTALARKCHDLASDFLREIRGDIQGPTSKRNERDSNDSRATANVPANLPSKPSWNADTRELTFRGEPVRKIRAIAGGPILVLNSFHELKWPIRIDSPLKRDVNLREVIRTLNSGLKLIRFEADGSGKGIIWKPPAS